MVHALVPHLISKRGGPVTGQKAESCPREERKVVVVVAASSGGIAEVLCVVMLQILGQCLLKEVLCIDLKQVFGNTRKAGVSTLYSSAEGGYAQNAGTRKNTGGCL